MAIDFPGMSPAPAAGTRGKVSEQQTPGNAQTPGSANMQTSKPDTSDTVRISDTAQALQRSVGKQDSSADVDTDRVAQIKAAIDSGSYKIDNERVAERMLQFDKLLG